QTGYFNDRQIRDEIKQYRVEIERQVETPIVSALRFGLNYTDHAKSLAPNESFVTLPNGATIAPLPQQYRQTPTDLTYLGLGPMLS
ncbi:hypothetical protein, partial [Enterobacter hormaechei]